MCAQVLPSGGMQYSTLRRANEAQETEEYRMPDATVKAGSWTVCLSCPLVSIALSPPSAYHSRV